MTSELSSSTTMGTAEVQCTTTLRDDCNPEVTIGTSTRASGLKESPSHKPMSTAATSRPKLKRASHPPPVSSSLSTMNSEQVSTSFGDEPSQSQKRQKRLKKRTVPTENHLILRRLTDEYDEWENGLTKGKDKLHKCEVAQCVGIIMKYAKSKSFLESDDDYPPDLLARCRQGWELFRAQDEFLRQHPECSDQCKRNGEWFFTDSCL